MMTDVSKTVVWQADYWPFGQVYSVTGSATNNLRFPGQYFLVEAGLDYNWYRHYDETLGRYIQPDPWGFINGPSLYSYVKSRPIDLIDPLGAMDHSNRIFRRTFWRRVHKWRGFGIIIDGNGDFGWYRFYQYGASTGEGFNAGLNVDWSWNAKTICDQGGPFYSLGVSAPVEEVQVSGDYYWGNSPNGPVSGVSVVAGAARGISVSSTTTYTWVHKLGF
jgi:RHS repeat-associated protein